MKTLIPIEIESDRFKLQKILLAGTVSFQDILDFYDLIEKYNLQDRFSLSCTSAEEHINNFQIQFDNLTAVYNFDLTLYYGNRCYNKIYERKTSCIHNFLNQGGMQELTSAYGASIDFNIKLSKSKFISKFIDKLNDILKYTNEKLDYYQGQKQEKDTKYKAYMDSNLEFLITPYYNKFMKKSKYYDFIQFSPNKITITNLESEYKDLPEPELKKLIVDELINKNFKDTEEKLKLYNINKSKIKEQLDIIYKDYLEYAL